jgi:hypothetical protein
MTKKIVSFGDSFIFGSEQENNEDGSLGWPGRAATELGCEYQTLAYPGRSNDYIAQQIYSYFATNTAQDTLAVINWTWISRLEFYVLDKQTWITLGSTCIPQMLEELVARTEAEDIVNFYHSRLNAGILWNKLRNLQTINSVQAYLKQKNITNIQTYMDYDMFDMDCRHDVLTPDYINELQKMVYPNLELFEGQNFLDWSKNNGYLISGGYGVHPLEDAHQAAGKLWQARYAQALGI